MGRVPVASRGAVMVEQETCSSNDCLLALEEGGLQYGCRVSHAANGGAVLGAGGARGKNGSRNDLGSRFVGQF